MDVRISQKKLLMQIDQQEEDLAKFKSNLNSSSAASTRQHSAELRESLPPKRGISQAGQDVIGMIFAVITCPLGIALGLWLALETGVYWWNCVF